MKNEEEKEDNCRDYARKNEEESRTSKKICEESMNNARIFCKNGKESTKKMKNVTLTNFVTNFRHGNEIKGSRCYVLENKK